MSGGKGGSQKTEIPGWLAEPAKRNLARAEEVQGIGYTPHYGPSLAAFNAPQHQAFENAGAAGRAFGLAGPETNMQPTMGAQNFGNGIMAHESGSLYDMALAELQQRRPGQYDAINNLFIDPMTGRPGQAMPQAQAMQPQAHPGPMQAATDGGGGMWSDGMTASQVRQHQADRTFGATAPSAQRSYQDVYDSQMASYNNSGGGISIGGGNSAAEALGNAQSTRSWSLF